MLTFPVGSTIRCLFYLRDRSFSVPLVLNCLLHYVLSLYKFVFSDRAPQLVYSDYSHANAGLSELDGSLAPVVLGMDCCMGST